MAMNSTNLLRGSASLLAVATISLTTGRLSAQALPPPASPDANETAAYVDAANGSSAIDLVRRALSSNRSLLAARLDIQRAEGRLLQAELYPNPSLDLEHTTGRLTGAPDERESAVGISFPLELSGKRRSRIDLARAELDVIRAQFTERQRQLSSDVLGAYVDALASVRELEATSRLNELDVETGRYLETRVKEGDAAPLELALLRVEIDRLRSRRELLKGRLDASLIRLEALAGMDGGKPLRLRESLADADLSGGAGSAEEAVAHALANRPDLAAARAAESVADATLRFARAQAVPDVTPFGRIASASSAFDDTPIGKLTDRSKSIAFGVSITLPIFNRNQGLRAEAAAGVTQARQARQSLEATVRADVASAYRRLQASAAALAIFERGVIERSDQNLKTLRAAYQLGEYRITDLIAEQRRVVDAQREYTDLLAEHYRAAVDLQLATGDLTPDGKGAVK
jgi:cobalt-zinc-cadmium efflux system outer membrane protein